MPLPRFIPVPDDIPNGYQAVVLVFMEFNAKQNTGFACKASDAIITSLRSLPMDKRHKVIKTICSNIQQMLLQYCCNPGEVTQREVGPHEC